MSVVNLALNWGAYEPSPGVFASSYVTGMRALLQTFKSSGMRVILDAGMQYPPTWVFNLDGNTRFVNQYGDVFTGDSSGPIPNAVFDNSVRQAQANYIARIAADFGNVFFGVRVGGLQWDELRYPGANFNGHTNSYWAFDAAAQASSPVPGWRPGQPDQTKAAAFLNYYNSKLSEYQNFLLSAYRGHFSTWLLVLYPSWGLRPGDIDAAVNADLDGSTLAAGWSTLAYGLDWARQIGSIHDKGVVVYSTWLERPDDSLTDPVHMSPVRYLARLASSQGLQVAGENAGPNADATFVSSQAHNLGLMGVMWLYEPSLITSTTQQAALGAWIWTRSPGSF